jgi:hypothetical protein
MSEEPQSDSAKLLHNLGTDPAEVSQGTINMKRFGVYDSGDKAIIHYASFRARESLFWRQFLINEEDLSVGVGGRGRRDTINGTSVERGNVADMKPEKPGPIDSFLHPDKKKAYEDWKKENEIE